MLSGGSLGSRIGDKQTDCRRNIRRSGFEVGKLKPNIRSKPDNYLIHQNLNGIRRGGFAVEKLKPNITS
ncbi:hypothetical protein scyTo_0023885 [Scyliorhinus torazame]|uniref:Uncharacterized protein n=1 Tax=Scyliorhinus torazame TaxID=75743 RepID=A0A401QC24_SCYTO|nr:hypothetical protein [Scyliorhinus torazame]